MALGGVDMGSIKAQLLAMVTGIKTYNIGIPSPIAIPAITGAKTATKATLLINSVMNSISKIRSVTVSKTWSSAAEIAVVI